MSEFCNWKITLDPDDFTKGTVGSLQLVNLHDPRRCAGRNCIVHNPSAHHMSRWRLWLRENGLFERICHHGVGHPDPDALSHAKMVHVEGMDVHGCDGCCRPPFKLPAGRYLAPQGQ